VAGVTVRKTGNYVIPTFVGWVLTVVGAGLLTTLRANTSLSKTIGFQIVIGGGVGIIYVVTLFPILASIPVTQTAPSMALYVFSRNFGYVRPPFYLHPSLPHNVPMITLKTKHRSGVSPLAAPSCRTN
jgi:hypothetical protein